MWFLESPLHLPEKLLGDGVSTPMPIFYLISTIISNKNVLLGESFAP